MLKRLEKEGGTSFSSGTILGDIFQYSERQSSILENISMLTKYGEEESDKNLDEILGTSKPKLNMGILSTTIQFSAQTSSARLQAQIMHKLIKKSKDSLGAPKGRKVRIFMFVNLGQDIRRLQFVLFLSRWRIICYIYII